MLLVRATAAGVLAVGRRLESRWDVRGAIWIRRPALAWHVWRRSCCRPIARGHYFVLFLPAVIFVCACGCSTRTSATGASPMGRARGAGRAALRADGLSPGGSGSWGIGTTLWYAAAPCAMLDPRAAVRSAGQTRRSDPRTRSPEDRWQRDCHLTPACRRCNADVGLHIEHRSVALILAGGLAANFAHHETDGQSIFPHGAREVAGGQAPLAPARRKR